MGLRIRLICDNCVSDRKQRWKERYPLRLKASQIREKCKFYKIDISVYVQAIIKKECGICGGNRNLHVDHDHDTGRFRGILCRNCNIGLGHFRSNRELLLKAVEYLV